MQQDELIKKQSISDENYILKSGRERPTNFQDEYRRLTEAKLHPEAGQYNPGLYKDFNTVHKENAIFKSKSSRKIMLNQNELNNPHSHQ